MSLFRSIHNKTCKESEIPSSKWSFKFCDYKFFGINFIQRNTYTSSALRFLEVRGFTVMTRAPFEPWAFTMSWILVRLILWPYLSSPIWIIFPRYSTDWVCECVSEWVCVCVCVKIVSGEEVYFNKEKKRRVWHNHVRRHRPTNLRWI